MTKDSKVQAVYAAQTPEAQRAAYDDWAQSYEQELMAMELSHSCHRGRIVWPLCA